MFDEVTNKRLDKDAKRIARILEKATFNERGQLFWLLAQELASKGEKSLFELFRGVAMTYKKRHDFNENAPKGN